MKFSNLIFVNALVVGLLFSPTSFAASKADTVESVKAEILELATSYAGQGDPDQSKQKPLELLVEKLVQLSPQLPIKDRLPVLEGAWKQVWGPYDYRNDDGGVDPTLGVDEIYQVVSGDGYYYNVAPYYPNGDRSQEKIGLLRGEFVLDTSDVNGLKVKFTDYPGADPRPVGYQLWELAPLAEAGTLPNATTIVPSFIVRAAFGGGKLEEVYTDSELRIVFGTSARPGSRKSIYVMTRAN
jgi:hypothetical protein